MGSERRFGTGHVATLLPSGLGYLRLEGEDRTRPFVVGKALKGYNGAEYTRFGLKAKAPVFVAFEGGSVKSLMPLDVRRTPPEAVSEMMFLLSDALGHASASDAPVLEKFRKIFLKFQQEFNKRREKPAQESLEEASARIAELGVRISPTIAAPALSSEQHESYLAPGRKLVKGFGLQDDDSEEATESSQPG